MMGNVFDEYRLRDRLRMSGTPAAHGDGASDFWSTLGARRAHADAVVCAAWVSKDGGSLRHVGTAVPAVRIAVVPGG